LKSVSLPKLILAVVCLFLLVELGGLWLLIELFDLAASPEWLWSFIGFNMLSVAGALWVYAVLVQKHKYRVVAAVRSQGNETLIEQQKQKIDATEDELIASRRQYISLFQRTADAMMIYSKGQFTNCNPACLALFECRDLDEFIGIHPSEFSPAYQADGSDSREKADKMIARAFEKRSHRFEWLHRTKNGKVFPAEVLLTVIDDYGRNSLCAIVRDITKRKRAEEEIRYQAYYDSLTGLPNRRLMLDRIEQSLASSRRHGYFNALLFVDLDRFKYINDSLGHSVGDDLLIQIAEILKEHVREEDTVARFGGDEFVILLKHLGDERESAGLQAEHLAQAVQNHISQPYRIDHHAIHVTSSIGIYLFPNETETLDDIIKQADTAMYSAKDSGRNKIAFFQHQMQASVVKRLMLEKDLREALSHQALDVYFQPQISADNQICGVEALVRWHHPEHGLVNPEEFIAVAEDSGIIYELGDFVLKRAIEQTLRLDQPLQHLSVNISPYQFRHADFVGQVAAMIKHYKLPRGYLVFEITEGVVIEQLEETIARLKQLREIGIRVSLDDFGTGYSSLSYLKRLPLDELKIDKSFVQELETDPSDAALVETIIKIAHQFDMVTVAEGVETESQHAFLQDKKCRVFQGYLFSRPLPFADLTQYMREKPTGKV